MKKINLTLFILLIFGILVVSCTPNLATDALTESENRPQTSHVPINTITPTKTLMSTYSVTATPNWEKMMASNEELFKEIERTPNCKLPCWWGIIPGKSKWQDVETRLSNKAIVTIHSLPNGVQQGELLLPVLMESPPNFLLVRMIVKSDTVQQIEIGSYRDSSLGGLRAFLTKNGIPDEIWVHSYYHNMGGSPPFIIWLFYWEKGMAAYFYNSEEESTYENGLIKACIKDGPVLYLWSDSFSSLTELKNGRISFLDQLHDSYYPILPIKDAIGIDVEQFYQKYGDEEDIFQSACFTSDRSLWPYP